MFSNINPSDLDDTVADERSIRFTAIVLAIAAFLFHAVSCDQVIHRVANGRREQSRELMSGQKTLTTIWVSLKEFFTTSIFAYFWKHFGAQVGSKFHQKSIP